MKKSFYCLLLLTALYACKDSSKAPDVSGISVNIPVIRFDQDFFRIDTNDISGGLRQLQQKHPGFYIDFMQQILGVSGADSNQQTIAVTRDFIRGYTPVQQYIDKQFSNTAAFQKELEQAFRYVKHYFPQYKTSNAILFTGPFDAPGVANTNDGFAFGLQQYAGKDFKEYQATEFQEMFPTYISRRFSKEYMVANCMKSVADEIFPDHSAGKPLIEQMIEKGKQWYLLDKFLPTTPDSLKTGYTQKQLEWCAANEGSIWSYLVKSGDLNSLSPAAIQIYIGEAPFTQGMPQEFSPGNLGQWIGWQIVKKFVSKNEKLSIEEVMRTAPSVINEQAKYKPK